MTSRWRRHAVRIARATFLEPPSTQLVRRLPSQGRASPSATLSGGRRQQGPHARDQIVQIERLGHVVSRAKLGRVQTLGKAENRGHDHHRYPGDAAIGTELAQYREAVPL